MKLKSCYWAVLASALLFQSCGGGGGSSLIGDSNNDKAPLNPTPGTEDLSARPRPTATIATITTDESAIYDVAKKPLLLRGINMQLGEKPTATRIAGIKAIKETGSNVVRLNINENTTDPELEAALIKVVEQGLVAIITLDSTKLACSSNTAALNTAVDALWLKQWLGVIAQDRFQPYIMINIANSWGPEGIFNPDSYGYQDYLDVYKALISKFRTAGFKLPLVIDAPCGQDFNAFARERGRELVAADTAKNIVLSVHADGSRWNTSDKLTGAVTNLAESHVPFVVSAFTGSGFSETPIDHLDLIERSSGDAALALILPWTADTDSAAYIADMAKPTNLAGGAEISTNVYIDARYLESSPISDADGKLVPKGKLIVSLYAKDADGNALKLGSAQAKDLRGYQWNKLRFPIPKTKEDIDPANLMNGSTSFDLTTVSKIGFEVSANGKSPKVGIPQNPADGIAPIKFDDLVILPGVPPLHTYKFTADTEGWAGMWGKAQEVTQINGSLGLLPKGNELVFGPNLTAGELDLSKEIEFTFHIFVPAEYNISSMGGQVFGKFAPSSDWNAISFQMGGIKTGEWVDWKVKANFSAVIANPANNNVKTPTEFGFQMWGLAGTESSPILIDSITVTDVNAKPTKTITASQYKSSFAKTTEGYEVTWGGKSTVSVANGELILTTPAGDGGAVNNANISSINEIDFKGGITVKAKMFIPADYAANDLWIKFFFQDGNWHHFAFSPDLGLGSFTPGAWTDLEFKIKAEDFPADFSRTLKPNMFGFQFANTVAGSIKIKDIEIVGQLTVDDSQPIFNADFSSPEQFDTFKFDFAGGSFTQSALTSAKVKSWKIVPFGWMATTWFGNTGDSAVLNITKTEDKVDLTERGEEIVNSAFGIKATSAPAMFTAPK